MNKTTLLSSVFSFAILAVLPHSALAHAHLVKSVPAANEEVRKAPQTIVLQFSEDVEAKFSKIEIIQSDTGKLVDTEKVQASSEGKNMIQTALKARISPGKFRVKWKVTSTDTHKSHGEFDFKYLEN